MFGLGNTRDWDKKDESNDRAVTEAPVSSEHQKDFGDQTVDAVPGCWWRPGSRN